jgi:hypothetical protein
MAAKHYKYKAISQVWTQMQQTQGFPYILHQIINKMAAKDNKHDALCQVSGTNLREGGRLTALKTLQPVNKMAAKHGRYETVPQLKLSMTRKK